MATKKRTARKGANRKVVFTGADGARSTPEMDDIVLHVIGRVADKWTMCVLEVLEQNGTLRFSRVAQLVGGVSQRMLTKTLRAMEGDGFVSRRVYAEVPPRVEYTLTDLGTSLCSAFCGVWTWAEKNSDKFDDLRRRLPRKRSPA